MKAGFSLNLKANLKLLVGRALLQLASEIGLGVSSIKKIKERLYSLELESIREESFGDYACTLAMEKAFRELYAKENKDFSKPRNFASAFCEKLREDKEGQETWERLEVAGPGFINLSLAPSILIEYMVQMRERKEEFLLLPEKKRKKIIFEYVSANPTGPLNIVSARAASLGDACAKLCKAVGHELTREYYVNDYGNQILLFGQSLLLRYLEKCGCSLKFAQKDDAGNLYYPDASGLAFPKEGYHGEYMKEIVEDLEKKNTFSKLNKEKGAGIKELKKISSQKERQDLDALPMLLASFSFSMKEMQSLFQDLGQKAVFLLLQKQKENLKNFKISFDNYFHESLLHEKGKIFEIQKKLEKKGLCYKKENAIFFRSTSYGDDKDRVLIRQDGRPSYFLADIAYHADKIERGFEEIYNIWGPDHHGYIARLTGAMEAMGYKGLFKVMIAQQVNLLEGTKTLRMSKRAGYTLSLQELVEEVPLSVARYFFVMRSFTAPIDFDLTLAKDESEKNPYYYVAYAHARISSIFRRADKEKLSPLSNHEFKKFLANSETWEWTPERRRLLLQTVRFTEEVQAAAEALEPHRLPSYLYNLASFLSQFYVSKENRVIQQDPKTAACLLTILELVALCLKKGLNLLGTEAPERLLREGSEISAFMRKG